MKNFFESLNCKLFSDGNPMIFFSRTIIRTVFTLFLCYVLLLNLTVANGRFLTAFDSTGKQNSQKTKLNAPEPEDDPLNAEQNFTILPTSPVAKQTTQPLVDCTSQSSLSQEITRRMRFLGQPVPAYAPPYVTAFMFKNKRQAYDQVYWSARALQDSALNYLKMARTSLAREQFSLSCEYLTTELQITNSMIQADSAAVQLWTSYLNSTASVVEIIRDLCVAITGLGGGIGFLVLRLVVFPLLEYWADVALRGESPTLQGASKRIVKEVLIELLFKTFKFRGKTIDQRLTPNLRPSIRNSTIHKYLKQIIRDNGTQLTPQLNSKLITVIGDIADTTTIGRIRDKLYNAIFDFLLNSQSFSDRQFEPETDSDTALAVVGTSPSPSATNVSSGLNTFSITFDEQIQSVNVQASIINNRGQTTSISNYGVIGDTLILTPAAPLQDKMSYGVSLQAGSVRGIENNELNQSFEWGFITGNDTLGSGTTALITNTGGVGLRLRSSPNGQIITTLPEETRFTVNGNTAQADGYTWWQGTSQSGQQGWAATGIWLVVADNGGFRFGAPMHVANTGSQGLRLRSQPGLNSPVITTLPEGTQLTMTGEPVYADSHLWYPVAGGAGEGYCAVAKWLTPFDSTAASTLVINQITTSIVPLLDWGQSITYNFRVTDGNGLPISGALVGGQNNLISSVFLSSNPTDSTGLTSYTTTVPNNRANGIYTIVSEASRIGYSTSVRRTSHLQVRHGCEYSITPNSSWFSSSSSSGSFNVIVPDGCSWAVNTSTQIFESNSSPTVPQTLHMNPAPIAPVDRAQGNTAPPGLPPANVYPSTIPVQGLTGVITKARVVLNNMSHTFPDDFDVLLVSPSGQKSLLMSDTGGGHDINGISLTFDQTANSTLPDNPTVAITSGTYRPSNYNNQAIEPNGVDNFPSPGPGQANFNANLDVFNGTNPNGTWSLYVVDDENVDAGSIGGGWVLELTTGVPSWLTITSGGSGSGSDTVFYSVAQNSGQPRTGTIILTSNGQQPIVHTVNQSAPISNVQVTVGTNPSGRSFTVDGTSYTSTQSFSWIPGSNHTIGTSSLQSGGSGTQHIWNSWNDGGAISHTVTPTSNTTYTANFTTQHQLTMTAGTGGAVSPPSGWFNAGQQVPISATANSGYNFMSWTGSGSGSYSGTNNPVNVTMNSPITQRANFSSVPSGRTKFDFDGDGKADVSVFRPSNGAWYLLNSQNGFYAEAFGLGTDRIVPADYDGDGKTDIAVYRNGIWYLQRTQSGFTGVAFGSGNDIPQPADFDGDGKAELVVFRPLNGTWYVLNLAGNQVNAVQFGANTDKPVVADYDGDGKADYAVFRNGTWYIQRSQLGFAGIAFGESTDKPVPADYDGDGKADVAVFRPSNGTWYLLQSTAGFAGMQFGLGTDLPVPADYDGDGKADIAVFRNGTWYLQRSTQGFMGIAFGAAADKPVPNAFVP